MSKSAVDCAAAGGSRFAMQLPVGSQMQKAVMMRWGGAGVPDTRLGDASRKMDKVGYPPCGSGDREENGPGPQGTTLKQNWASRLKTGNVEHTNTWALFVADWSLPPIVFKSCGGADCASHFLSGGGPLLEWNCYQSLSRGPRKPPPFSHCTCVPFFPCSCFKSPHPETALTEFQ